MSLLNENDEHLSGAAEENQDGYEGEKPSWFWDENTPGVGERPSFLPEKYKTVAEVAKAQRELESRLGQAPAEYDFSKGDSWMDPSFESFQELASFAKSKHVPQDVMDKMLESVGKFVDEFKTNLDEEKKKLGENSQERLRTLNNWAKANLSERSFHALTDGLKTAESIQALEELRSKFISNNTLVPGNDSSVQSGLTLEAYRSELQANYTKYKEDPHYRKEMERKLNSIVKVK